LINSHLYQFLMNKIAFEKTKGAFTKAKIYHYYSLPVKDIDVNEQAEMCNLVEAVLLAKKADPTADTSALEAEIDQLVYKLYGLTDEEIAIVEGRGGEDGAGAAPSGARSGAGGGTGAVNRRTGCAWRDQPGGTRRRAITETANDEDEELE
jgi:hypothetical protein